MRRLLLTCPLLAAAACGGGGDDDDDRDLVSAFSVVHYDYAVSFLTREATSTLTLDATGAGRCFALPYALEEVGEVTIDGEVAGVSIEEGVLTACGRRVDGETVTLAAGMALDVDTLGQSDVGFSPWTDANGAQGTYLLGWVNECDRFGPCDSTPSAFATYRFTVEHDPSEQVLCPGVLSVPEPGTTVCDFAFAGGPTYSTFGIISGEWEETALGDWGGVSVTLHDLPATGIAAALQTSSLRGFFTWMEATFGEYPYGDELRLVTANTWWLGFEHPGNIVLNDGLAGDDSDYLDPLTHVTLHEIAHQWAGDETTLASTYDFVWKEAMAEYLTFVYEDEALAPGIAAATAAAWKGFSVGADHPPVPDYAPALFSYYGDVYGPGPMVLFRQLEVSFGRAAVIAALQDLLGTPRALSVGEVQAALETHTGADLDAYFDAWVFGSAPPAWPEAAVSWNAAGGTSVSVSADVTTADGIDRGCRFTVQLTGTAGNAHDVVFDLGPSASVGVAFGGAQVVDPGFTVTGALLDPYSECLVYPPGGASFAGTARRHPWSATPSFSGNPGTRR